MHLVGAAANPDAGPVAVECLVTRWNVVAPSGTASTRTLRVLTLPHDTFTLEKHIIMDANSRASRPTPTNRQPALLGIRPVSLCPGTRRHQPHREVRATAGTLDPGCPHSNPFFGKIRSIYSLRRARQRSWPAMSALKPCGASPSADISRATAGPWPSPNSSTARPRRAKRREISGPSRR